MNLYAVQMFAFVIPLQYNPLLLLVQLSQVRCSFYARQCEEDYTAYAFAFRKGL